jgi:gamma-glutamylcyclotransferase (GGCT)/AIG2-like uncharacterized protein YtfP
MTEAATNSTTHEQRPFFFYGTLKPGEGNYAPFLGGRTLREQPATISGAALFTEGPYPYLVIGEGLAAPADVVQGYAITIQPAAYAEVLQQVDQLEDYIPGDPQSEYMRIVYPVQTEAGPLDVWVYVAGARVLAAIRAGQMRRIASGIWGQE